MTIREKLHHQLNDEFRIKLTEVVREKFGIEVDHRFDFWGTGCLITTRADEADFTPEQHAFVGAYSEGFSAAMSIVGESR
jgi:hypothetical protein